MGSHMRLFNAVISSDLQSNVPLMLCPSVIAEPLVNVTAVSLLSAYRNFLLCWSPVVLFPCFKQSSGIIIQFAMHLLLVVVFCGVVIASMRVTSRLVLMTVSTVCITAIVHTLCGIKCIVWILFNCNCHLLWITYLPGAWNIFYTLIFKLQPLELEQPEFEQWPNRARWWLPNCLSVRYKIGSMIRQESDQEWDPYLGSVE